MNSCIPTAALPLVDQYAASLLMTQYQQQNRRPNLDTQSSKTEKKLYIGNLVQGLPPTEVSKEGTYEEKRINSSEFVYFLRFSVCSTSLYCK